MRLKISDNSSSNVELQDEEIDMLLSDEGSKERAAISAARAIGANYARKSDKKIGRLAISMGQVAQHYFDLADELEKGLDRRTGGATGIYAGGIRESDKLIDEQDPDRVAPAFAVDQFDNPGTGLFSSEGTF